MYIKKNMFDNIFNMVIDVKGKTKDNMKARMDLALYCDHHDIELLNDRLHVAKLKTTFALDNGSQLLIYE